MCFGSRGGCKNKYNDTQAITKRTAIACGTEAKSKDNNAMVQMSGSRKVEVVVGADRFLYKFG
jgi:hypothetical protein